jgi:hypothetical protein
MTEATHLGGLGLNVRFDNGEVKTVDLQSHLDGPVFKPLRNLVGKGVFGGLKDEGYFRSVRPAYGGIMWPHEQDFSPETIEYELQG